MIASKCEVVFLLKYQKQCENTWTNQSFLHIHYFAKVQYSHIVNFLIFCDVPGSINFIGTKVLKKKKWMPLICILAALDWYPFFDIYFNQMNSKVT